MVKTTRWLFMLLISISLVEEILSQDMWSDEVCRPSTYFDLKFYDYATFTNPETKITEQALCDYQFNIGDMESKRVSKMTCCVDPVLKYVVGL